MERFDEGKKQGYIGFALQSLMGEGRSHFSYQYLLLLAPHEKRKPGDTGYPLVELQLVAQPRGGLTKIFQEVGTLHKGVPTETGEVRNDKEAVGYFIH